MKRPVATSPAGDPGVGWKRPDGTTVPLDRLNFPELVAAHQQLVTGEWSPEDTRLLLAAIESELELRWRQKTQTTRETPPTDRKDGGSRAA